MIGVVLSVCVGIISWGGTNLPLDWDIWTGIKAVLKLTRALCSNAWDHKEILLGEGRMYGNLNALRMRMAEVMEELSLIPYAYPSLLRGFTTVLTGNLQGEH